MNTQQSKYAETGGSTNATNKLPRRQFIKIAIVASSLVTIRAYHYNSREEGGNENSKLARREGPAKKANHDKPSLSKSTPAVRGKDPVDVAESDEPVRKSMMERLKITEIF